MIRILLIALLLWCVFRLVFRLSKFFSPDFSEKQNPRQTPKQEGDVTVHIDKKHQEELKNKERKGEYVDYEEVE